MEDSYTRLLRAAKELRQLDNAAQVARELEVSDQTIQNWKTRGVPNGKLIKIEQEIGASPKWISTGEGPMKHAPQVAGTLDDQQRAMLEIMGKLDSEQLEALIKLGALLSREPNKTKRDIKPRGVSSGKLMKKQNIGKRKLQ